MPWTEVSPGHHQRPLGENERFIKAIGDRAHAAGREHWSITAYASFKISDSLKHILNAKEKGISTPLRQAWKILRFHHPSIAATASHDDQTLHYMVPEGGDALEKWVDETFFIHENDDNEDVSPDELIAHFKPSEYVTGHYLSCRSSSFSPAVIMLHFAHWRTDGFGALQLVNAFLEAFTTIITSLHLYRAAGIESHLPWGQETKRLTPSVEEALNVPMQATPEIQAAAERYIATLAHTRGAVGVSYRGDNTTTTPPAGTRSVRLRLPVDTTEAIIKACEDRGISLLAAVHASTAAITYAAAPEESRSKHYTSTMRFSLRPYLPEPYNNNIIINNNNDNDMSRAAAAGLYTGGYMFKIPAHQSWMENARQYHDEYQRGVTSDFLQSRRQYALMVGERLRQNNTTTTTTTMLPPDGPPPSEVDISSVDDATKLVDPVHRSRSIPNDVDLEILDVSVGVETLTRQLYCFVWTFRGRLEFNLVYNEAYYDAVFGMGLLEDLKGVLKRELHII